MANIELLMRSISYIEDHLDCDIQTEDIAQACYASKSNLEKTFRITAQYSVHDYILRRRMMKSARLLVKQPEMSILDVAVQYGFSSHEAFTRAFFKIWNCNPSDFRTSYSSRKLIPELFPQITGLTKQKDQNYTRKIMDLSELYDILQIRKNCYLVCADIESLISINEISMKAGDISLSETLKRMLDCSKDDDVIFRFGPDEFALLTNSTDIKYAEEIREKIIAMNGQTFDLEDTKIPLRLRAGITKLDENALCYAEMYKHLHQVIRDEIDKSL